jgi:conjugal transfer pilus assembly protein TraE
MKYEKFIRDWKTALAENFFLRSLALLMAIGLILNASIFKTRERIIVVPPQVSKEFWIEKNRVSPAYLEQMGVFFATLGGNLSPVNAGYNVNAFLDYIAPENFASVKAELASQALYITKNNITQAFFPSSINVNEAENRVRVEGETIRNIGTVKVSKEKMVFNIRLKINNYRVYLDELSMDYPDRTKAKAEAKEKEEKAKERKIKMEGGER